MTKQEIEKIKKEGVRKALGSKFGTTCSSLVCAINSVWMEMHDKPFEERMINIDKLISDLKDLRSEYQKIKQETKEVG